GMGPGGGMQPPAPMGQEPKEEGPAEEAPEEEARPADQEPLAGYPEQSKRKLQIFEVDGYLRTRVDYLHNPFMDQGYTQVTQRLRTGTTPAGLPPFPVPLECPRPTDLTPANINSPMDPDRGAGRACPNNAMGGANLRLRLEPTLNVTDM